MNRIYMVNHQTIYELIRLDEENCGKLFADHERIAQALGIKIFFAHPYSS